MFGFSPHSDGPLGSSPLQIAVAPTAAATASVVLILEGYTGVSVQAAATLSMLLDRRQPMSLSATGTATSVATINRTAGFSPEFIGRGTLNQPTLRPIRGMRADFTAAAFVEMQTLSVFDDLLVNPSRRRVYAVEISAVLTIPYDEAS